MTATVPAILKYLSESNNYNIEDQNMDVQQRAKKRRLDHLSWEEKVQRKKLKNRVAAQTSRDRKKAKMDQMESAIQELFAKNEILMEECEKLKLANERLMDENEELRTASTQSTTKVPFCANCKSNQQQSRPVECETMSGSEESLLQPQGIATHSAATLPLTAQQTTTTALLKIVLACLLYRTSLTSSTATSTSPRSNSSRRASSRISPETWRRLLKRQIFKYLDAITIDNSFVTDEETRNQAVLQKWWGRHQNNWNPLERQVVVMC